MYNVENTAVCLLQEYCVLNFEQIDVKNELHSNVEMGKRKKNLRNKAFELQTFRLHTTVLETHNHCHKV